MEKIIYLDNAATTRTAPEVLDAMIPYFTEKYGNPSTVYSIGSQNKDVITKQREIIAEHLELSLMRFILLPVDLSQITGC